MSRHSFSEIKRFIRFDKKSERVSRVKRDRFIMISAVWDKFIENCQSCYIPGQNLTVDEQLFPTKARYPFTQYTASKPDKFGIKFWLIVDVDSKYLLNAFPYLGKDDFRPTNVSVSTHVVLKLAEPLLDDGRAITMGNYFTSISLAQRLLQRKTTLIGTIRTNRRELPAIAKAKKDKLPRFTTELFSTQLQGGLCILTVYKSEPNKKMCPLSTKHPTVKIANSAKRVPETVQFYNANKFGVDVVNQMARKYSTKTKSRRWHFQVFCNILDLAALNAHILYTKVGGVDIPHQEFYLQLAEDL